jgi:outer membrane protein
MEVFMKKGMLLAVVLSLILGAAGNAFGLGAELAIGGWQQSLGGTLGYEIDSNDDIIDLDKDLDVDDEFRIFGRANIDLPLFFPNIYLMVSPTEFDGTGSKDAAIKYGDVEFSADAELDASLSMNQYDIALYWGIPLLKTASNGIFNIDLGLNIRIVDLEASLSGEEVSTSNSVEESVSQTVPIPMAYVAVQIEPIDELSIALEGRGIAIGDNSLYSIVGRIRYQFTGPVFAAAGYRSETLEIDEEDILVDIDISGPFAEIGVIF